ncbi:hypothetical protein [Salinicoccus sp. HZC-1]|uniref:hypothetical protein n=1 Tax=Salinicoccus sp. HZC-1 TaxID=3385497 RepID=UPI00398B2875
MIKKPLHSRCVRVQMLDGFRVKVGFVYVIDGIYIALIPQCPDGVFGFGVTEMRTGRKLMSDIKTPNAIDFDKEHSHVLMDSIIENIIAPKIRKIGIEAVMKQIENFKGVS